jgi:hypothetical protein
MKRDEVLSTFIGEDKAAAAIPRREELQEISEKTSTKDQ